MGKPLEQNEAKRPKGVMRSVVRGSLWTGTAPTRVLSLRARCSSQENQQSNAMAGHKRVPICEFSLNMYIP